MSELNELASLKFAIKRALSTLSIGIRGKYRNVRLFSVDLPLSQKTFVTYFAKEYKSERNFKKIVTVESLNTVFGRN